MDDTASLFNKLRESTIEFFEDGDGRSPVEEWTDSGLTDIEVAALRPKATAKIADDREEPPTFYDLPLEHWIHLRHSPDGVEHPRLSGGGHGSQRARDFERPFSPWPSASWKRPKSADRCAFSPSQA